MKIAVIIRVAAEGQYVAHCPSLPGCTVQASTKGTVERKMRDAVTGYLASMDVACPSDVVLKELTDAY